MKHIALILALGLSLVVIACDNEEEDTPIVISYFEPDDTIIYNIGHRGTGSNNPSNPYPENTIISFEQAINVEGADGIELDVYITSDGTLVVTHDESMDVSTNCSGCVSEKTAEEVTSCTVSSKMDGGESDFIPTLRDALETVSQIGIIDIELKFLASCDAVYNPSDPTAAETIAELTVQLIEELEIQDRTFITSFSVDAIKKVEEICPEIYTGLLYSFGDYISEATYYGFDAIAPSKSITTESMINSAFENGLGVFVWTVNNETEMQNFIDWNVNAIITDNPDVLEPLLD